MNYNKKNNEKTIEDVLENYFETQTSTPVEIPTEISQTSNNFQETFLYQYIDENNGRSGREIKVDKDKLYNRNVSVKIGCVENKSAPHTVFINVSFWTDIKNREELMENHGDDFDRMVSRQYSKELNNIYKFHLKEELSNNFYFPYYHENIYTYNFPDNLNYNDKRSFTSIDLNLHTINCLKKQKEEDQKLYSLNNKKDTEMFEELLRIAQIITELPLLKGEKEFNVYKRKK